MEFKSITKDFRSNWLTYLIDIGNFIYENIINKKKVEEPTKVEEPEIQSDDTEISEESIPTDDSLITPDNWKDHLDPNFYYEPSNCINCRIDAEDKGLLYKQEVHWNTDERGWVCTVCNETC